MKMVLFIAFLRLFTGYCRLGLAPAGELRLLAER